LWVTLPGQGCYLARSEVAPGWKRIYLLLKKEIMKYFKLFLISTLLVAAVSCNSDKEDLITIDDFVGSWKANSFVLTNNSNSSETFDLVANGGEVRFTMLEGGRVRTWIEFGTFSDEWDALATLDGNTMTTTPAESTRPVQKMTYVMDGSTLTLTNKNSSFDFTLDGEPAVPATSVAVFVRN
jgi:hypothetical protein